jgi:hypothetical protein
MANTAKTPPLLALRHIRRAKHGVLRQMAEDTFQSSLPDALFLVRDSFKPPIT